jgi:hypothetical protein
MVPAKHRSMPRGAVGTPAVVFSDAVGVPGRGARRVGEHHPGRTEPTQQSADPGQMTFTESVSLIDDGVGLERDGAHTDPTVDGHTVSWQMEPICRMGPTCDMAGGVLRPTPGQPPCPAQPLAQVVLITPPLHDLLCRRRLAPPTLRRTD